VKNGVGCYLEIVENEKLVWTNVLAPGYRPVATMESELECENVPFTAVISLEPHAQGTKYTALAIHGSETGRKKHDEMGFHEGWGAALDQLVALALKL
jgi:uncharacterized protein YndB with AHSA1/START domain